MNIDYFYYLLSSKLIQEQFLKLANGAVVKNIRSDIVKKTNLLIPPIAEQKQIVKKVEKLFSICDKLQTQITANKIRSEQLMQAVLKEAFTQSDTQSDTQAETRAETQANI
jgi:type I restriction enzyme S subunit